MSRVTLFAPVPPSAGGLRHVAALLCLITSIAVVSGGCQSDPEARLAEIRAMQAAGQFDSSIQPLRVLLTTQSNHPEANYRLGVALMQTGRKSLAVWPLQKAAESPEYAVQSGLLLASALLSTEAYEEAIRAADRVLAIDPDRVQALYTRAHANIGAGRPEDALADADHVLELRPDDSQAFAIRTGSLIDLERFEEAEEAHRHLKAMAEQVAEGGGDEDKAARACGALAMFYAGQDRADEARQTFDECLESYPAHPLVRQWASDFYARDGQLEKTFEIWRLAIEESPEDLALRSKLADLLLAAGRGDEAAEVLVEGAELFDTRASWQLLASMYRKTGDHSKSRAALEKAIERSRGEPETLRFALGDLLVAEGDYERAEEVAASLKEPSYRNLLRGSILLAKGEPKAALSLLETGLRLWPNNAGARYMAGSAALQMGDTQRAMAEFREAVRVDERETDASLELARLYFSDGKWKPAQQFAERHIAKRPFSSADAHVIAARAAINQAQYTTAQQILEHLKSHSGQDVVAITEYAALLRQQQGAEAAVEAVRKSDIDLAAAESVLVLRALALDLISLGRTAEALATTEKALDANPENPDVLDLQARILIQMGRQAEAKSYAERALAVDAQHARALEILGSFAAQEGREKRRSSYSTARPPPTRQTASTRTAQHAWHKAWAARTSRTSVCGKSRSRTGPTSAPRTTSPGGSRR